MITDKMFHEIARGTINPGQNPAFGKDITERASSTGDMQENLWLMYAITFGMGAKSVLEIGTNDGTSTLAFLKAVSDVDPAEGRVTSVDICDTAVAREVIKGYGMLPNWEFHKGSSHDILKGFIAEGREFDVALVDGDHSYEGAEEDVKDVAKMLVPGGVLFTHDNWCAAIEVDHTLPFGERGKRGDAFLGEDMLKGQEWVGLVFPFGCNLGVFRRRADCVGEIENSIKVSREAGFVR